MTADDGGRIGIITGEAAPELTTDGQALRAALERRGWDAEGVRWDRSGVDWTQFNTVLVRSCWAYHERLTAFREWLARVERDANPINPGDVLRWNVHKSYLRELADRGVSTLATEWIDQSTTTDLSAVLDRRGWDSAVVKPAVGTSSVGVWRTTASEAGHQRRFERLSSEGDVLVQAYAPEIQTGERSLVFFAGEYSHATTSQPADGDFRAHPNYGGTVGPYEPPPRVVEQARDVLTTAAETLDRSPSELTYARVDGIERGDEFVLVELELVEPHLSLHTADGAVETFADAVVSAAARSAW